MAFVLYMRSHLVLIVLAAVSASCSGPYSEQTVKAVGPAEAPAEVRVERVDEQAIPEIVSANGELFAEEEATLGTQGAGARGETACRSRATW